jgi:hypothetical protein
MSGYSEVYTYTDQPTVCPKCGIRTSIIRDLFYTSEQIQQHLCPSAKCRFEFFMQIDTEE